MINVDQDDQRLLAAANAAIRDVQHRLQALSAEAKLLYQQQLGEWEQCRHSLEQLAALLNSQTVGIEAGIQREGEPDCRTSLMADEARLRERHAELAEKVFRHRQTHRLLEACTRRLEAEGQWLLEGSSVSAPRDHGHSETDCADRILQAREQERLRLAREIHDGPAQVLANAVFELEYFERLLERDPSSVKEQLAQLKSDIRNGLAEVRRSMYNLRPPSFGDVNLFVALRHYLQDFGSHFGLAVESNLPEARERLSATKEVAIFRVFQEALQNVQKHANASRVVVRGELGPATLQITVEDDGQGFDPVGIETRNPRSLGLITMRERAGLIGGQLEVASSPGQGTRVTLVVPRDDDGSRNDPARVAPVTPPAPPASGSRPAATT